MADPSIQEQITSVADYCAAVCAGISRLLNDDDLYEEGEQRPSDHAINVATSLILEAHRIVGADFPNASVSAFEGAVRITWSRPDRQVRLICPSADGRQAHIYHEEIQHGRSRNYDVLQDVTGEILARWLRWFGAEQ